MKKGTMSIVFGWLLVAIQIMALMGSNLDSGFARMGVIGLIGYFLPGILGIMLLCKGYKKRSRWQEEESDTKPETLDVVMKRIRAGLTGDPTKDRVFLNNQIQSYRNHPLADEIIGSCAKLLANTLSDDELNQWGQAMKADDERKHSYEAQKKQTVQREKVHSSEETEMEWETTESVNEDGSKVVTHINNRTNEGIIQELDSQGNIIRETFGKFEEVEQISDEELDDYLRDLAVQQEKSERETAILRANEIREIVRQIASDVAQLADRIDLEAILADDIFEEYELGLAQELSDSIEDIRITLCRNADELTTVAHILERTLELPQEKAWNCRENKSQNQIYSMNELYECHCEFQDRIKMALYKMGSFVIESEHTAFCRDYVSTLKECREKIDRVNAYNERSIDRIRENIALMEQKKSVNKAKVVPPHNGADLPQSGLEILLSGMRDYQEDSSNPFVFNRIMLGMVETPLYFAVDMEYYKGSGKPDIGYIMKNVRRFPVLNNLIVALVRNEDLPSEGTTVKPIPLRLEEYIPAFAEKKEPLLLLDPIEGNPVVIPSEAIGGLLLSCAKEKLGE